MNTDQIRVHSRSSAAKTSLLDDPGVAAINKLLQTAGAGLPHRRANLVSHHIFVSWPVDGAEDSDRLRKLRLLHAREHEGHRWITQMNIVYEQIVFGDAVFADRDHFRQSAVHANTFLTILTKYHWLAVFEIKHAVVADCSFREVVESAVVEDVAVLVDLDKRDAFVFRCGFDHRAEMFDIDIDRARDESRLTCD